MKYSFSLVGLIMYVSTVGLEKPPLRWGVFPACLVAIGPEYITSLLQQVPGMLSYATLWKY